MSSKSQIVFILEASGHPRLSEHHVFILIMQIFNAHSQCAGLDLELGASSKGVSCPAASVQPW